METEENDGEDEFGSNVPVPLLELKRTVNVRMMNPGPQTVDEKSKECESFLRGSDDSIVFKRLGYDNKGRKKFLNFRLTFSNEAKAQEVCSFLNYKQTYVVLTFSHFSFVQKSTHLRRRKYFQALSYR